MSNPFDTSDIVNEDAVARIVAQAQAGIPEAQEVLDIISKLPDPSPLGKYVFWEDESYRVVRLRGGRWSQLVMVERASDRLVGLIDDEDWEWDDEGTNAMAPGTPYEDIVTLVWRWCDSATEEEKR